MFYSALAGPRADRVTGAFPQVRWWGGWGSNPRPADYEKYGLEHRTRYLHGYHGFAPLKAVIAPFARVTRSTNRSTVATLVSAHSVTVRNIAKSVGLTSAANGDTVCRALIGVSSVTQLMRLT